MRFEPLAIDQYRAEHFNPALQSVSQSNPEPLSSGELEALIGPVADLFSQYDRTGYSPSRGSEALRQAITHLYSDITPDQVVTFAGAQEAIFCIMHSLLKQGDKVVAITPIFEPLIKIAQETGCEVTTVSLQHGDQWSLDLDHLQRLIKDDCRMLVLNFPHNPTGAMIKEPDLRQLIDCCRQNDVWLVSDEVFRGLEYDPSQRLTAAADQYIRAISIGVMSKAFALPAIRIGWIACQDRTVLQRVCEIKAYLSICNGYFDEILATEALKKFLQIWERNRLLLTKNMSRLDAFFQDHTDLFQLIRPQAGCVCFPLITSDNHANDYAEKLIQQTSLLALPGHLFMTSLNGIRLGFGYSETADHLQKMLIPFNQ